MKPLPKQNTLNRPPFQARYKSRPYEDINSPSPSPSKRLIAPTLNLTNHHQEGLVPDPDVVGLFGFGGGIVGNLESNAHDGNLGEIIEGKKRTTTDSEKARKISRHDQYNAIGEDFVEGVGNVGNKLTNDDDDSDEENSDTDTDEIMITNENDGDIGLGNPKNYLQSQLFGGGNIYSSASDPTSTIINAHHGHRHSVHNNVQHRHHYDPDSSENTSCFCGINAQRLH